MRAAIDTFEQDCVNVLTKFFDGIVELDTVFFFQRFCVVIDAIGAFGNVRAAAFERSDDLSARNVVFGVGVVQVFGESGDMGGVAADDADAEVSTESGRAKRNGGEKESAKCPVKHHCKLKSENCKLIFAGSSGTWEDT